MKTKSKVLAYIFATITVIAAVFACIFTSIDNNVGRPNLNNLSYDLTDTIGLNYLKFEEITQPSGQNPGTCKFTGIGLGPTRFENTLSIPEEVTIDSKRYTVVEIDTELEKVNNVSSLYVYGSYITALIVPDTVTKINGSAFYGMASLQYLQTPFPDEITSFDNNGVEDNYALMYGLWPIHKLFSRGYFYKDEAGRYQDEYKLYGATSGDQKLSEEVPWYETTENSKIYFQMPSELEKIVITKADNGFGNRTFVDLDSLEEVVLPEGLMNVGEYTFASCGNLASITLPSTLRTLSTGMFSECSSLPEITLPKVTAIPENCFGGCKLLNEVIMPTGIKTIGESAFANCLTLHTKLYQGDDPSTATGDDEMPVILPDGLEKIGDNAFQSVKTITIFGVPNNVTEIGKNAFIDCTNLTNLTIPFVGKSRGTSANAAENDLGYIFGKSGDAANNYYRTQTTDYRFPNSLDSIMITEETILEPMSLGNLCECNGTQVVRGVKTITVNKGCQMQAGAFAGSNALENITIPHIGAYSTNSIYLDNIGYRELKGGYYFGDLFLYPSGTADDLKSTGGYTQTPYNSINYPIPTKLVNVIVNNQNAFATNSFYGCNKIENLTIGNDTNYMANDIFWGNENLNTLSIPFVGVFRGQFNASWWWYWKDVENRNMFSWIFSGSESNNTYQDNTIAYYSSYRKYIPNALENVKITNETEIDYRAFRNLYKIKHLTISDAEGILDHIESGAASGCSGIVTLDLPYIGYNKNAAGSNGDEHRAGYIFGSKESTGYNAFGYYVPEGLTRINIDFVNRIPNNAFRGMTSLQTVAFNTPVTEIGAAAFKDATKLSSIIYSNDQSTAQLKLRNVQDSAFQNCGRINTIVSVVPEYANGNITLGDYAFAGTSISEIDFTKITSAGKYCFSGCLNLTEANVTDNTAVGDGLFANCIYLTDVTLAEGKASRYMFENCSSLEHIDLTRTITDGKVPDGIFKNCTSLKWGDGNANVGLALSDQITEIGAESFYGCTGFDEFVIPGQVTKIGDGAFYGANNLPSITIPVPTVSIGEGVFTDTLGHGFTIWVYTQKEQWPWKTGWNCNNPVKVLPGIDDSMYTYRLSDNLKGYLITGIKQEYNQKLKGTLVLPSTHDGVSVVGIACELLANQDNISKVVVPYSYKVIQKYAFQTPFQTDIYFERELDNAPYDYDDLNDKEILSIRYNEEETLRNLTALGLVFFGDAWQYGVKSKGEDDEAPYVKLSQITFSKSNYVNPVYNGNAWTPDVESVVLPAIVVGQDGISTLDEHLDPSVFSYSYENNIYAGTATINTSIHNVNYKAYLSSAGNNAVLLTGSGRTRFTIEKQELKVLYDSDDEFGMTHRHTNYSPDSYFKVIGFNNQNVTGLESGYTFEGVLAVRNHNAGSYWILGEERNEDFYWERDWVVRYNGRNVTDNFKIGVYLDLEVSPLDVIIDWYGYKNVVDGKYQYEYNGTNQLARAVAYAATEYDNVDTRKPIENCIVTVEKATGMETRTPGQYSDAYAYLSESSRNNFNVVNDNAILYNGIPAISGTYGIVRADLNITVNQIRLDDEHDYSYLIPYDATEYRLSDWSNSDYITITGLAERSRFTGEIMTVPFGTYSAHAKTLYSYSNGGIDWNQKVYNIGALVYDGTSSPILDYLVASYDDDGNIIEVENDYYNMILDAKVNIIYNTFEFEYYAGTQKLTVIPNPEVAGYDLTDYEVTYKTDGVAQPIEIHMVNDGLILGSTYTLTYGYQGPGDGTSTPMKVKEIGDYVLHTTASRDNFNDTHHEIIIHVIKSDIEHIDLSKEYDGEDVDISISNYITKQDMTTSQNIQLQLLDANKQPCASAINPGKYYVRIIADETAYFNGRAADAELRESDSFTISKRKIHIYVDREKYFDEASTIVTSSIWDGNKYSISIDSSALAPADRKYMVGNDNVFGVLWTKSSAPGIYDTSVAGDWYWSPAWSVYDGVNAVNKANTYYEVVLHGVFLIDFKEIEYTSNGVITDYDGNFYSINVNVTEPSTGYRIYYSLLEPYVWEDEETTQLLDNNDTWRTRNYTFQVPDEYIVYFKIVMDNYKTVYGSEMIRINYVPITFDDPEDFNLDGDNKYYVDYTTLPHFITLQNVDPMGACVEYSLDNVNFRTEPYAFTEIGDYVLNYRISYPNYETVEGSYSFRITEENLTDLTGYVNSTGVNKPYDGLSASISVVVTYSGLTENDYKIYYRPHNGTAEWSLVNPAYANAGTYKVDYLVSARGFKAYTGTEEINISTLNFGNDIDALNYVEYYDGEAHSATLVGVDLYPGVRVLYTSNADLTTGSGIFDLGGWEETPISYKNVGTYHIYVAFILDNYNPKICPVDIIISKTTPTVNYTDDYKIQYLGTSVAYKDLGVTTIHDGNITTKYYEADFDGTTYTILSTTTINAPYDLGYYYVTISYADTSNCYPVTVQFGFEIVQRRLTVSYYEEFEYTGGELSPSPTVDSGIGIKLDIGLSCYEVTDGLPVDIGTYHFKFEFATTQKYFVLEHPESPEMSAYPYIFKITKIKLEVNFHESMPYDYDNQVYWYKDSGWEAYDFYDKILNNQAFVATMRTSSYARGTYLYNSVTPYETVNTVIVTDPKVISLVDGSEIDDIYEITFDIRVDITIPLLDVVCEDRTVKYDGLDHGLNIIVPDTVRNLYFYYADEDDYEAGRWWSERITYSNVGTYKIYYKIESSTYDTKIGFATLTITEVPLVITINDFDETYDAFEHKVTFDVDIQNVAKTQAIIRYYKTSEYDIDDIDSAYAQFDEESAIFKAGIQRLIDAGDYYAVVFFKGNGNYTDSYAIKEITVKQRPISITLNSDYFRSFDYDGYKKEVTLGAGATYNSSDLVYGHRLVGNVKNIVIQTISPDAGTPDTDFGVYNGSDGFEFKYDDRIKTLIIRDAEGNDVTLNYRPTVSDSQLQIIIEKISLPFFNVSTKTRPYNGMPADPVIDLPIDGAGEVVYTYYELDENGNITSNTISSVAASNVGTYYVACDVLKGNNYKAYTGTAKGAKVTITQCEVDVEWENTTKTFNGDYQAPDAYITDVDGNRVKITVQVRYNGLKDSVLHAGVYDAIASYDNDNYLIKKYVHGFTIEKITYDLVFEDESDVDTSEWSWMFGRNDIEGFLDNVDLYNSNKNGNPVVSTVGSDPGRYVLPDQFSLDYSAWVGTEDVTSSINFNIKGVVVIYTNKVIIEVDLTEGKDYVELVYDPSYDASTSDSEGIPVDQFIRVVTPKERHVSFLYSMNNASYTIVVPKVYKVGTYIINYACEGPSGYDGAYGSFVIKIVPKQAVVNFVRSLNKPYDGLAIDDAYIISRIDGEYNGAPSDLVFTYYRGNETTAMTDTPINAGSYRIVVTSNADTVDGDKNYSTLYAERYFEITAASLKIVKEDFDCEYHATDSPSKWESGTITINNMTGLGSYRTLHYELSTRYNKQRGTYKISGVAPYDSLSTVTYHTAQDSFEEFAFSWYVLDDSNNDVSFNYNVEILFKVKIHYPYMQVHIDNVEGDFKRVGGDPVYYSGDDTNAVSVPTDIATRNLVKEYGPSASNLSNVSITQYAYSTPGTYPVYYRYTCDGYEPFEDSFTIKINRDERQVTLFPNDGDLELFNKEYDGNAVGTYNSVSNQYLPNYTSQIGSSGMPDTATQDDATMVYYVHGQRTPLPYATDAGTYDYEFRLPETIYYTATLITGTFTIERKTILVDGTEEVGYMASYAYYSNFNTASSNYTMTFSDGTPIPSTFSFPRMTIQTSGSAQGEYKAQNETLYLANSPIIMNGTKDVTKNYQIILYRVASATTVGCSTILRIKNGKMVAEPYSAPNIEYDGLAHGVSYVVRTPSETSGTIVTATYSESLTAGTWQSTPITKTFVGNYTIYIKLDAPNYDTEIIQANLNIVRANTRLSIPNMDTTYTGQPVMLPANVKSSNNTEAQVGNYVIKYRKYTGLGVDPFEDIPSGEYPVNAGTYKVIVTVPTTDNYEGVTVEREFTISGIRTSINWGITSFTYNGSIQQPVASFSTVNQENVNKIYTIKNSSDVEVDPIIIGTYTISLTLEGVNNDNYIFDDAEKTIIFSIVPRPITIRLNTSVTYDNDYHTFNYTPSTDDGFKAQNIVDGHYVQAQLKTKEKMIGNYTNIDSFTWISATGDIVILDQNNGNSDVTSNYIVDYRLAVNINYSSLQYTVEGFDGTYDGLPHSIKVTIQNVFSEGQSEPTILYSKTLNGTYTQMSDEFRFTDVVNNQKIYFRILCDGYQPINGPDNQDASCYDIVNITKKIAALSFADDYLVMDKYYDGQPIANPQMKYADKDINPRPLTWTYYKKNTDPTNANYGNYEYISSSSSQAGTGPTYVGEYKLEVSLGGGDNYELGTFEQTFVIRKRKISISNNPNDELTKVFNGDQWKAVVNADNTSSYINIADNLKNQDGLVPTEVFVGTIKTRSANVGSYSGSTGFTWQNGYKIYSGTTEVQQNYELSIDMSFEITLAQMNVDVTNYEASYDGKAHTITIDVIDPEIGYTIYYSDVDSESAVSTTPITQTATINMKVVYFRIVAPNYEVYNGSGKITITGVVNDGELISPRDNIVYGEDYDRPAYRGSSNGTQTVTYYNWDDITYTNGFTTKPTQAGKYRFKLNLDTDGIYSAEEFTGQFEIAQLKINVVWEDLTQEYTGESLSPSASVTTLEEPNVNLDVTFADDEHVEAGSYGVSVSYANSNYRLVGSQNAFTITKKEIAIPNIKPDMEFEYRFEIALQDPIVDENGDPVLDENDEPTYNTRVLSFGDLLEVRDIDDNLYVLDDEGQVIEIRDAANNVIDANPNLDYRFVFAENMNACAEGEYRTLKMILNDKDNYRWADVENKDEDQIVNYKINPYVLPNIDDNTSVIIKGVGTQYEKTGEEIKPVPTVILRYGVEDIYTFDSSEYDVSYPDNDYIESDASSKRINITSDGNIVFDLTVEFMIVDEKSKLFALRPGVIPMFIKIEYNNGISIFENYEYARTDDLDSSELEKFYLGHIKQRTYIQTVIDQIDVNNQDLIDVYSIKGELIDKSKWSSTFAATGMVLKLHNEKNLNEIVDSVEIIVFGDLNGDGVVNALDALCYKLVNGNKLTYNALEDGSYASDTTYTGNGFISKTCYYATMIDRTSGYVRPNALMALQLKLFNANKAEDFNAEYEIN